MVDLFFKFLYNKVMLKTLKIKNVALTTEAVINFDEKLNIISGETGAGKSVLLDALGLILGGKTDKNLIKYGEEFLKVEAVFENVDGKKIQSFFEENDLIFDSCIIISRKVSLDGKNEIKLNGESVPLMYIKQLGALLVDIHLQNENNKILDKTNQLKLIDNFVEFDFLSLEQVYSQLQQINSKINELSFDEESRNREIDLLTFQISEIENAKISEDEEENLKTELIFMKNAEKIASNLNNIKESFEGTYGILNAIRKSNYELSNVVNLSGKGQNLLERLNSAEIDIEDIYDEILNSYDIDFSEEKFEEIDSRLEVYKNLHKKYGITFTDIQNFLEMSKERLAKLQNFEAEINTLNKQKQEKLNQAYALCKELTEKRIQKSKCLQSEIKNELVELSMQNAQIEFEFNDYDKQNFESFFTKLGADSVQMLFSANLGESVKPLNLVASGGEISRLVLAIKTITTKFDEISTIIFDELDTGLSGEASVAISKKLAKISRFHQIISVSHQFQICAMADKNILIKKIEENGKTISIPKELVGEEMVSELCRFLSVNGVTESTISHAKEVKEFCENYKNSLKFTKK